MIALVSMRSPERITVYPSILDLQEVSGTPKGQESIRLWEDASGMLVGFTLVEGSNIAFDISSQVPFEDLARHMIDWMVNKLASTGESSALVGELETGCREEDTQRSALLEQQGFIAQPVRTLHFIRRLNESISTPHLPEGFLIRPIVGEEEAEALVELHHDAHGTENMTVEFRLSMMRTPEYDRELDLVAVSPKGQLAANVMCHYSSEENRLCNQKVGYTDPVATHPDFQRKGLANALLLAGFSRLKERGIDFSKVSTWGENNGMIRTAESVGYRLYSTTIFFKRPLLRIIDK